MNIFGQNIFFQPLRPPSSPVRHHACLQYKKKLMMQSPENGQKPHLGPILTIFGQKYPVPCLSILNYELKTKNELQSNAKGNQKNTSRNPSEKPKNTKPKPKKAEKKEPVEKNGNVITEENGQIIGRQSVVMIVDDPVSRASTPVSVLVSSSRRLGTDDCERMSASLLNTIRSAAPRGSPTTGAVRPPW